MPKLNITFFQNKCIGAKKCLQIAPDFFSWDGEKAFLNKATTTNDVQELAIDCNTEQVKKFIEAASSCPVNAIKVVEGNILLVGTEVNTSKLQEIVAEYDDDKEFILDKKGYFLIKIDKKAKNIEVGFCNERNIVILKVVGKKPIDIYHTIINKLALELRRDHCAYLGRELQKAYLALQMNIDYVQDDELEF